LLHNVVDSNNYLKMNLVLMTNYLPLFEVIKQCILQSNQAPRPGKSTRSTSRQEDILLPAAISPSLKKRNLPLTSTLNNASPDHGGVADMNTTYHTTIHKALEGGIQ